MLLDCSVALIRGVATAAPAYFRRKFALILEPSFVSIVTL
jgi:hypothetical protein